jgi:hypothetical protein
MSIASGIVGTKSVTLLADLPPDERSLRASAAGRR